MLNHPLIKPSAQSLFDIDTFRSGMVDLRGAKAFLSYLNYVWKNTVHFLGRPALPGLCKSTGSMVQSLYSYYRRYGVNALIQYMKASQIAVKQYLAGSPLTTTQSLGVRVRLRKGLPAYIPTHIRSGIRSRSTFTCRFILTFLAFYRAIEGVYSEAPYTDIYGHPPFEGDLTEFQFFMDQFWTKFIGKYYQFDFTFPKTERFHPHPMCIPLVSAGPNSPVSLFGAGLDAVAWSQSKVNHPKEWFKAIQCQWPIDLMDQCKERAQGWANSETPCLGRIHLKFEPAGKVRMFAICDYWTQLALRPLHDFIMDLLASLPTDATFEQEGATESFASQGHQNIYSFDLKAATDTIPLDLYKVVLHRILGTDLCSLWGDLLVDRVFQYPRNERVMMFSQLGEPLPRPELRYSRGQPMGAYSSWASMALTHHALVQFSAHRIGEFPYTSYRILGDD